MHARVNTVVYDGDCGVCGKTIEAFERAPWASEFEFVPYQTLSGERLGTLGTSAEACARAIHMYRADGSTLSGADVMLDLFARYGGVSGALARMTTRTWILRLFARAAYAAFAERRERISAMLGLRACGINSGTP